jgi:hypothetical protein
MTTTSSGRSHWALLGATIRLQQIEAERAEIYAAFPQLREGQQGRAISDTPAGVRKRRTFSPAAKKRMAEGMRKYWAKRRAAAAKAKPAKA